MKLRDFLQCKSRIYNINNTNLLDVILEKYSEFFDLELGKMKDVFVKILIPSETKPTFYKAGPVPYAIKEKVENELERLVNPFMHNVVKWPNII